MAAVGLEANTDMARPSGLEVDPVNGGFLVNAELMARQDLYVVGGGFGDLLYVSSFELKVSISSKCQLHVNIY